MLVIERANDPSPNGRGIPWQAQARPTRAATGKYAFPVRAGNNEIVATDGGQAYNSRADAKATLEKLMRGDYNGPSQPSSWVHR
jgi:uncharacterized protein YegP (UPF0339 family)